MLSLQSLRAVSLFPVSRYKLYWVRHPMVKLFASPFSFRPEFLSLTFITHNLPIFRKVFPVCNHHFRTIFSIITSFIAFKVSAVGGSDDSGCGNAEDIFPTNHYHMDEACNVLLTIIAFLITNGRLSRIHLLNTDSSC